MVQQDIPLDSYTAAWDLSLRSVICLRNRARILGPGCNSVATRLQTRVDPALGPGQPQSETSCLVQPGPKQGLYSLTLLQYKMYFLPSSFQSFCTHLTAGPFKRKHYLDL